MCAVVVAVTFVVMIAFMAGKMNPSQIMLFMVPVAARTSQGTQAPVASVKEILTGVQPARNTIGMAVPEAEAEKQIMGALGQFDSCDSYCCRRNMLARAVGAAAITLGAPALAAETKMVLMGVDVDGSEFNFSPKDFTICKGDSLTFKNNFLGPHNVVFDPDDVPAGVDAAAISSKFLNKEGETHTVKLDKPGDYGFYCEKHRGSGMSGVVTVMS